MATDQSANSTTLPEPVSRVKSVLERRGIGLVYFPDGRAALQYLLQQIPLGASIMSGGSATLKSIGFEAALRTGNYDYFRPKITALDGDPPARIRLRRRASMADYFVGGINAISLTGEIVNADGSGNRVAAYAYSAGKVYLVAGINKIEPDLPAAIHRLRHRAAVEECRHLGKQTPCAATGVCDNYACDLPDRQCGKLLIIEAEKIPGRITVVMIGEMLGY